MKPLDRVRQLVQLAASAPEEEARTAAVQACRLIARYGLTIGPAKAPPKPEAPPIETPGRPITSIHDLVGGAVREAASRITVGDVADVFVQVATGRRRRR